MNLDNAAHAHVSCKSGTLYLCAIPLEIKLLIFFNFFLLRLFPCFSKDTRGGSALSYTLCPNQCGVMNKTPTQTNVDCNSFSVPGRVLLVMKSLPPIGRRCYGWLLAPLSP